MQPLLLAPYLNEALKMARVSVPENIIFHRHISRQDMMINGDAAQMQQVLMNLIGNACDAVEGIKEPVISVKLREWEADAEFLLAHPDMQTRQFARLTVEDNGSGIPADCMDNIFEPFFTTKGVGKGTGLGLAMVYGAVQSHGGILNVDSEAGRGTCFQLYLPLLKSGLPQSVADDKVLLASHGETVLLADDEAQVRQASKDVLESLGYRVLEAANGKEAIDVFYAHADEIELLILDVVMPQLGGVEAAMRICELKPHTPVIFATGYDKEQVAPMTKQLEHSLVLNKPFVIGRFSRCIRKLLDEPEALVSGGRHDG